MMRSHWAALLLLLVLTTGGGLVAWQAINHSESSGPSAAGGSERMPVAVELAPIESGLMRDVRVLSGTL